MEENSENTDFLDNINNKERYYTFSDFSELKKEKKGEVEEKYLLEDIKKWYILLVNVSERHAKSLLFCLLFIRVLEVTHIIVPNWMQSVYYRWKNEKSTVQNLGHTLRTYFQKIFEDYGIGLFSESLAVLDEFPDHILIEILKEADSPSILIKKFYNSLNLHVGTDDLGLYGHDPQLFSLNTLNLAYEELLHYNLDRDERGLIYIKNKQTQRRIRGAYFTPNTFAQFLVKKCLTSQLNELSSKILRKLNDGDFPTAKTLFKQINNLKILDPACGNGVFLTVAFRQIWEFYNRLQKEIEKIGRFNAVSCEFKGIGERILLNNIHGVDNDPQVVELTKLNLWLHLLIFERTRYSFQKEMKKKVKIPPLESNILLFNSIWQPNTSVLTIDQNLKEKLLNIRKTYREKLIESYIKIDIENTDNLRKKAFNLEKKLHKARTTCWNTEIKKIAMSGMKDDEKPIVWPLAFPETFFRSNSGFDIILTNPPFLAYHSRQTRAISSELLTL
ncbi:MAG: Eco57I restriction-modification methylase domain-containing protein, partial [Promethearchaeota archaeon]